MRYDRIFRPCMFAALALGAALVAFQLARAQNCDVEKCKNILSHGTREANGTETCFQWWTDHCLICINRVGWCEEPFDQNPACKESANDQYKRDCVAPCNLKCGNQPAAGEPREAACTGTVAWGQTVGKAYTCQPAAGGGGV